MAHHSTDKGSDDMSMRSEEALDDNCDLAAKYKTQLPIAKKKKPKRNRSAFIIFSSEMRGKIRSSAGDKLNSNEMMVKLATMWKELDEENKKKYHDQAEKEKVRYLLELNSFYQNNPFEVIQNKTKKNHVKKPCSAYALYLKEQKQLIKGRDSSLKMADILKIVGEKWKHLPDPEKAVYQSKAQQEKELTKAKINEHMVQGISEKNPIPQKRVQNQKRIQKALKKENIKTEQEVPYTKIEYDYLIKREEEPPLWKKPMIANMRGVSDFNMLDQQANLDILAGLSKFSIPDLLSKNPSRDPAFEADASYLVNLFDATKKLGEKSTEMLLDFLTFHSMSKQDSNRCAPQMSMAPSNSRSQALNDALMNCLQTDTSMNDFNLDALNNEAYFTDVPSWKLTLGS